MVHVKSVFPPLPPVPPTNIHNFLFRRPDQEPIPDHVLYVDGLTGKTRTRVEFLERVFDAATALGSSTADGGLGIGKDEVVGLLSDNCLDYPVIIHALIVLTVPIAFFSSYSKQSELVHVLRKSKATRLFVHSTLYANALRAAKEVGFPEDRIYILEGETPPGKKGFAGLIDNIREKGVKKVDVAPANQNTLAYLVFSSGTSGLPKAVMISHGNIIFTMISQAVWFQSVLAVWTPPDIASGLLPKHLAFLPFFHSFGLYIYNFRAFLVPCTIVLMPRWDLDLALDLIAKHRVTGVGLIPSVIHQLVNSPKIETADLSSLNTVVSGAAYLPPQLHKRFKGVLNSQANTGEGYGLSEATVAILSRPHEGQMGLSPVEGSTGILFPGIEARVVREDGTDADYDEIGELHVKAPSVALGYWNDEKATKEAFLPDGWLKTGDQFKVNKAGVFWFEDRAKDTLKISGLQVSPAEIENTLLAHPGKLILDVTVAGVPGRRTADEKVPRAWVVLSEKGRKKHREAVAKELEAWVQKNLSKYKWLRGGVEFIDAIPKSPTGKVLRRVLQDHYTESLKLSKARL